jgi:hypothetical protein
VIRIIHPSRWAQRTIVFPLPLVVLLLGALPERLDARVPPSREEAVEEEAPDRRLYIGMWTMHFRDLESGLENNWLLGVSWNGIYGATLVNSFGDRAYSAGMQGTLARWAPGGTSVALGYRVGLITGYDERFLPLARRTPVIPLVQPRITIDAARLGVELSYSGVVASAGFSLRF